MNGKPDPTIWRDPLALAMLAAWLNVEVDQLPSEMRAHTCPETGAAWARVADAAREQIARYANCSAASIDVEVLQFLKGAAPLEGVWFGDTPPGEHGAFWWRRRLPVISPAGPTA